MKRIVLSTFAALMMAGFFIACGPPKPPTKEVYITYAVRRQVALYRNNRRQSEKKMQSAVLELFYQYQSNGGSFDLPASVAERDLLLQPSPAKVSYKDEVFVYIHRNLKDSITTDSINAFRTKLKAMS